MRHITVTDTTLCGENRLTFREKLEVIRLLDRLGVDRIELPALTAGKADALLVRTAAGNLRKSVLSVAAQDEAGLSAAAEALSGLTGARICLRVPVSAAGMEYHCHKKPEKLLAYIADAVRRAADGGIAVDFCALDATRAERPFLERVLATAKESGAATAILCDGAGDMLPDEFAAFAGEVASSAGLPVSVCCTDMRGLACAASVLSVEKGADGVVCAVGGECASLETLLSLFGSLQARWGAEFAFDPTQIRTVAAGIARLCDRASAVGIPAAAAEENPAVQLDGADSRADVMQAVTALGYELSEEDAAKVYDAFCAVAAQKAVSAKELDAIVAATALQVPATYRLCHYAVNCGNVMSSSAQITLEKDGKTFGGISMGDGPISAAFLAVEQIIGHHYELDDFQIQSLTEGREAVGSALVRLRSDGKLYSGNGVSTDIIGASIKAYLNAVNKILYEETQA